MSELDNFPSDTAALIGQVPFRRGLRGTRPGLATTLALLTGRSQPQDVTTRTTGGSSCIRQPTTCLSLCYRSSFTLFHFPALDTFLLKDSSCI